MHGVVLLPVVVAAVVTVMSGNLEAGEKDGRDDENDAGDNHNPGSESVEPIRFDYLCRWRCGAGGDGGRRRWCFRCFAHAQMMRWQRIGRARCDL
jgi:hypothetical protein